MVAKRYTILSILGVAALVGICGNGFANNDKSCAATCANHYAKDLHSYPPLHGDAQAHFWCPVKPQDAEEACDVACPNNVDKLPDLLKYPQY